MSVKNVMNLVLFGLRSEGLQRLQAVTYAVHTCEIFALSDLVAEVASSLFIDFKHVFFPTEPKPARWTVIVNMFRSQAVHWVGCKPATWHFRSHIFEGLVLAWVNFRLCLSKEWHNVHQEQEMHDCVREECSGADPYQWHSLNAITVLLAIRLEDHAAQHNAAHWSHHGLCPPVHFHCGDRYRWNRPQQPTVVHDVNEDM
mmetsp:Transcript_71950/g.142756  ORF Transcript_71950/g.142756 Transcript_71950/m.142756 type:complete len:200 (-) Transcript_71950:2395-2994(-)